MLTRNGALHCSLWRRKEDYLFLMQKKRDV
ncbi:hypothetical protein Taro_009950 [Colocasia esculenta]|uniref:Uncharacterized protein n=1 Tax=Colocasia esculenta TaxID=4460 RepID=A0A843U1R3_COLES|nr:hypothetical protein [Colocasia esculenta]